MKRILAAYKDLIGIIFKEAPVMVVLVFIFSIVSGLLPPLWVWVNQNIFDAGLQVAKGEITFSSYTVFLVLAVVISFLPSIFEGYVFKYAEPRSILIFRTAYKARMLKKLKTMKYEHYENEASMETIDKAYNRTALSTQHLWPMYIKMFVTGLIASIGLVVYIASIRWWLVLTVIIPYVIETILNTDIFQRIYKEMETYWNKERRYSILGSYLRSRLFTREIKAFNSSEYLIDTYKKRLNERNKDYEKYFFRNIRHILAGSNISRIAAIINALILLALFIQGQISVGLFISMTSMIIVGIYGSFWQVAFIFKWAPFHINTYEYYDQFFNLSDEPQGSQTELPQNKNIEFRDVWFKYPGTEKNILKGLSFTIKDGEKVSIVGENGEGKSTIVKLLLGLFSPDKGEIMIGGKNLNEYPLHLRTKLFGAVFQDFSRYSIKIKENIGVGDIDNITDNEKIQAAARKAKVDKFAQKFEKQYDTLLGRDFEGGVDISGGQWQRIAIARAFMGGKPILLLDEPTSQLDPMAEANLYNEFAAMTENKTAVFITHRLGSTMITDKIIVISGGEIKETGTHNELMKAGGIYAEMFDAQKQWYKKNKEDTHGSEI